MNSRLGCEKERVALPYNRIGKKVFFRRFSMNLSLEDFAQATGVPKERWIELESGQRAITTDDIQLLSRLLDVGASWFLEDFEDDPGAAQPPIARASRNSMGHIPGLMEVTLPDGKLVVVDPDFDADALNRLIGVLERRG